MLPCSLVTRRRSADRPARLRFRTADVRNPASTRKVAVVRRQIEEAMPAEIEEDRFRASPASLASIASSIATRIACERLGGGNDPLCAAEEHRRLERRALLDSSRLDQPFVQEHAHQRRRAVVAQTAGVDYVSSNWSENPTTSKSLSGRAASSETSGSFRARSSRSMSIHGA